jgi:hypothetical protein
MKDYNKENLKRLLWLIGAIIIAVIAGISVSHGILFARIVTSTVAIGTAVVIGYVKYYLPEKEAKKKKEG